MWASLVALTMTLVCHWRLGGGASGGVDGKTKEQGVVSDDRDGTIPSLTEGRGQTSGGRGWASNSRGGTSGGRRDERRSGGSDER